MATSGKSASRRGCPWLRLGPKIPLGPPKIACCCRTNWRVANFVGNESKSERLAPLACTDPILSADLRRMDASRFFVSHPFAGAQRSKVVTLHKRNQTLEAALRVGTQSVCHSKGVQTLSPIVRMRVAEIHVNVSRVEM